MKKRLSFILCIIITAAFLANTIPVQAAESSRGITVLADGVPVVFDQEPMLMDGRVIVPARAVAEAMGWEYKENAPTVIELIKTAKYIYSFFV